MSAEGKIDFIVKPSTKHLCVWTFPQGSKPVVRVEVENARVKYRRLFQITCDTIGLLEQTRKYFALFQGILYPTKKYGLEETIYLPCKIPISLQRWSFDILSETRVLKTDQEAFRLIALQLMADIKVERLKVSEEEAEELNEFQVREFVLYKQYVERARTIEGYDSVTIVDVEIMKKVKLVSYVIQKGETINIRCNPKKLSLLTNSSELSIPWRKIRSFAEIPETGTIGLEVFISEEKAFSWIEVKAYQGTLLLQMIGEFINNIRSVVEKPVFRQPTWVNQPKKNKLTWKLFKEEMFGIKAKRLPNLNSFDEIDETSSDGEDEERHMSSCQNNQNSNPATPLGSIISANSLNSS